ncbi:MAG: hypothetical protein GWM92_02790 [Gemmatimonadetes bacterium]|nr:hypothetical protein [Gemmatimonadota bacterium]NIR78355.1 hypothetical protein [Gemmatimonadota bacterium]NIT85950.1 hypothetical protein [Gemmatimonadota bacterium]NIU29770.1 hypothetical protein [Gemmatimonadota bacterium]NIU37959.1 hypothetical protein [Gemmatimonadota bacterium]
MIGARRRLGARPPTLLILLAAAFAVPEARAAPPGHQEADTLRGTVRAVEEGAGVEVITGFHLALRVVYVRVDGETRVTAADRPVALAELEPGQVVRIRLREGVEGPVAATIEAVRPGDAPGGLR